MNARDEVNAQLARFSTLVVHHPNFRRALRLAKDCVERGARRAPPACLFVTGPSGSGKTTLTRELQRAFPRDPQAQADILPVLVAETPARPTVKNLAEAILAAMDVHVPWRYATTAKMSLEILRWLKARCVKALVIDEIQHFSDKTAREVRIAADYLKSLINQANLPIILLGLEQGEVLLDSNEQLRRRFSSKVRLGRIDYIDADDQASFKSFLLAVEKAIHLPLPGSTQDFDLAWRFHCATAGLPCHIMSVMLGAAEAALRAGRRDIGPADLGMAFRDHVWDRGVGAKNPFNVEFDGRPLVCSGEPFAYLANAGRAPR